MLFRSVADLPVRTRNGVMLSDQPGVLVCAGKMNVIGTRGQTDWTVLTTATSHGDLRVPELLAYLKEREVKVLHLSDPRDPLADEIRLAKQGPRMSPVKNVPSPHRMFRLSWP